MLSVVCWKSINCSIQINVEFSFQHRFTKKLIYHVYITGAVFSSQLDKIKHVSTMYVHNIDQITSQHIHKASEHG